MDHPLKNAKQFLGAISWKSLNNFRCECQKWINYKKKVYYETCSMSNADEFVLFYQVLPQKTLSLKKEKCAGASIVKFVLLGLLLRV